MEKVCFRCGVSKDLSHYYAHKQMADGHLNKCKDCTKKDSAKRESRIRSTTEGIESERLRHRDKYHRLGYKEKQKEWDKDKPWKSNTIYKSLNIKLRRKGLLTKGEVAHHWNYSDDFLKDVFVMSLSNHKKIHKYLVFDIESKIFLFNGIPLTNKSRHYCAILEILNKENVINYKISSISI